MLIRLGWIRRCLGQVVKRPATGFCLFKTRIAISYSLRFGVLEGQLCSDNLVHCAAMGFSVSNELGQLLFGQGNVETDGHIPWVNVECLQGSIKKKKEKKKKKKGKENTRSR